MVTAEAKQSFVNRLSDFDALWLTMFGEARGEVLESQIGVGFVILNRSRERNKPIKDICTEPLQFSCWNSSDPNLEAIMRGMLGPSRFEAKVIQQLKYFAKGIIAEDINDNTSGSNHYLATTLYRSPDCPKWAKDKRATVNVILGRHTFIWCP